MSLGIVGFGEPDLVEALTSLWVSINKSVEVNVGSHDSVVPAAAKDGDNGLNLPAIIASIVDNNLVDVSL